MPGFAWSAYRLARLRSAVRSFNAAVTRRAKELERSGLSDLVGALPERVTVEGVKSRISTVNDFRRIVGYRNDVKRGRSTELSRVLKSVNPKALDFTTDPATGALTTNYAKREYDLDMRAIRRQRAKSVREMGESLHDGDGALDFGSMSKPEIATVTTNNDLLPDDAGEYDDSVEDVDAETLTRWRQEDAKEKRHDVMPDAMYEVYMSVWQDPKNMHAQMPGYMDLVEAMEWLAENRTDVLNKMFNSGHDELDPQYVTESGGARNPYVNIPYETRHNRAVRFVTEKAAASGWRKDEP